MKGGNSYIQPNLLKLQNTKVDRITAVKSLRHHNLFVFGTEGLSFSLFLFLETQSQFFVRWLSKNLCLALNYGINTV